MKDTVAAPEAGNGQAETEIDSGKMSFLDHLDELRRRLVRIIVYLAAGFGACFYFSKDIYKFLEVPIKKALPSGITTLAYTNPTQPFTMYIKVAMLAGLFLTIPLSLYEVWKFIAPGLYRREKRYVMPFMFSSVLLFLAGGGFCYYFVLYPAFAILLEIGKDFTPVIMINEYFDLTLMMILGFGVIFEMPVVVAFLSIFGLVSAGFLWRKFRYALLIMVALAAFLSPTGDAVNLLVWTAPMIVLYLVSIVVAALFARQRRKRERSL
jgi:sec-independent protein translocase protein TatC